MFANTNPIIRATKIKDTSVNRSLLNGREIFTTNANKVKAVIITDIVSITLFESPSQLPKSIIIITFTAIVIPAGNAPVENATPAPAETPAPKTTAAPEPQSAPAEAPVPESQPTPAAAPVSDSERDAFERGKIAGLQEAILAIMEKNGPVTDQMRRDVENNVYHDSLINWVKSFR